MLVGNSRHWVDSQVFQERRSKVKVKATLGQPTPKLPGRNVLFGPPHG